MKMKYVRKAEYFREIHFREAPLTPYERALCIGEVEAKLLVIQIFDELYNSRAIYLQDLAKRKICLTKFDKQMRRSH